MIATLEIAAVAPMPAGRVVAYGNGLVEARGLRLATGAGARIARGNGGWSSAIVAAVEDGRLTLSPLDGMTDFAGGAAVEPWADATAIRVGTGMMGRMIDALGQPIDGRGPIVAPETAPAPALAPLARASVSVAFLTGVRAIDALMTLGRGQRVAVVAGSGVGKSTLLHQVLRGAEGVDVAVIALIGERGREIADFAATLAADPATAARTIVVAAPADAPAVLRLRAVERAQAIAAWFRSRGAHALLVADSLTRVAHAQRELGLALGEPPTMKGYPSSALAILPRLVEGAGGDARSGGAVTAIYTVLADGDDLDDPVVDTMRGAVDGHIILARALAEEGIFPAIDIARSLSRTMEAVVAPDQMDAARRVRGWWATAAANRDLQLIGAYRAGSDPALDNAFAKRDAIAAFISQPTDLRVSATDARAALSALSA